MGDRDRFYAEELRALANAGEQQMTSGEPYDSDAITPEAIADARAQADELWPRHD